ncbi:hypothetical protein JW898_03550 [Candidatus Woesearchaeota archaeon]|nr:hypothetical protein [Candidatus Woesearchaeota archaeon]
MVKVYVSLNGIGDVMKAGQALEAALRAGADGIHMDVLEGECRNASGAAAPSPFTPDYVAEVVRYAMHTRGSLDFPVDAGLFVDDPFRLAEDYIRAGASRITVPFQTFSSDPDRIIKRLPIVRKRKEFADKSRKTGLSFSASEIKDSFRIEKYSTADYITVVASGPGYDLTPAVVGIEGILRDVHSQRAKVKAKYPWFEFGIAVQGGITHANAAAIKRAGAGILVLGRDFYRSGAQQAYIDCVRHA